MQQAPRIKFTRAAARHLRLSKSYLEKARLRGEGPPYVRLSPHRVGYLTEDLDRWLESRRVNVNCEPLS